MSEDFFSLITPSSIIFTMSGFHPSLTDPVSSNNLTCMQPLHLVPVTLMWLNFQLCETYNTRHWSAKPSAQ